MIRVEGFDVNEWSSSRGVSFSVEDEQCGEGGFRKAYKCTSSDENFPAIWLLKKYNDKAKSDFQLLGMDEEEHVHTLEVNTEFGETFTYSKIYFGKITDTVPAHKLLPFSNSLKVAHLSSM